MSTGSVCLPCSVHIMHYYSVSGHQLMRARPWRKLKSCVHPIAFWLCRVQQQQFRVDMGGGGSDKPGAAPQQEVSCTFSRTPDLLFVLLPREVRQSAVGLSISISLAAAAA